MKELFLPKLIMSILIILFTLACTGLSIAQEQEVNDDEIKFIRKLVDEFPNSVLNWEQVYDKAVRSTILIIIPHPTDLRWGSGVLIEKKLKLAITNKHVVGNHRSMRVFFPARNKDGQLINKLRPNDNLMEFYLNEDYEKVLTELGYATEGEVILKSPDPEIDLAIIELKGIPETAESIDFASSDFNLDASPDVHIIGHPERRDLWYYDSGKFEKYYDDDLHIVSSAWHGNSGGPVLNDRGELVGIIWGGERERRMVSFAVPLEDIRSLRSEVKSLQSVYIQNGTDSTITYEIKAAADSKWQEFTIDGVQQREIQVKQPDNQLEKLIVDNPYTTQHWAELEGVELVGTELIEFPPGFPKIRFSENNKNKKKVLVLATNIQSFRSDKSNGLDQSVSRSNASTYHFSYDSMKEKVSLEKGPVPFNFTHIPPIIIQNITDATINYEVQWTKNGYWREFTIDGVQWREDSGQGGAPRIKRDWPDLEGIELVGPEPIEFPPGYPKIRFNEVNNDQKTDTKVQTLKTSIHTYSWNNPDRVFLSDAYIYRFSYDSKKKKIYLREGVPTRVREELSSETFKGWILRLLDLKNPYFYVMLFVLCVFEIIVVITVNRFPRKRHTFSIMNNTESSIDFQVKWTKRGDWSENYALESGALWTDWQPGFSKKKPQVRFNDGKETQERTLKIRSRRFGRHADNRVSREDGRKYHFEYNSETKLFNICDSE